MSETNIYAYTCNQNLKNRALIYKSDKSYEKYLDLLLYENHYMNIKDISKFFSPNDNNKQVLEPYSSLFPAVFGKTKSSCST